jgi:arsenate reductase (thioredoxin)
MSPQIQAHCDALAASFSTIPNERKAVLSRIAAYIQAKKDQNHPARLVYICTHNSRRSHFGQIWGAVAASYYGITNVETYSGGTEATAFHPNAIRALETTGFVIEPDGQSTNPVYTVRFGDDETCSCFSKTYDDPANPQEKFAAVMTCSDADENCPFIPGVELRIGTTYEDPKIADGTPAEATAYRERSDQIALETLYAFSLVH